MPFSNTKESGLETLIVKWLVEHNGYEEGTNADYNREYVVDETRLFRFLSNTQPEEMEKLGVFRSDTKKRQFLNRLQGEIAKRGVIDVLRNGVKVYPADLIMFYLTPTEGNDESKKMFAKNIFSVTRQLRYSQDAGKLALDLCVFINGLPVITLELKNSLTKQTTEDAVQQYKDDRDPRDLLFSFKRCMVHFAVDDTTIKFCTKLAGRNSWFLPFNKGCNDGAGNPPNPDGLMTDYLWKNILTKETLTLIIENYAQVVVETDEETKKKTEKQIFPRYHQLDVVRKLLADVKENGVGKRYLIQHSAGSGKSNSIAWLAHQLIGLEENGHPMIDSVLVVTDRRILDKQIRNTIKQFMQVKNTVVWAEHSGDLKKAIQDGKRIIVTTVEKFPFISTEIGQEHRNNRFAIIIDEAHSGQSGRNSANMNLALSGLASDDEMDNEDKINALVEGRKLLNTASYFAFTATPKNKTEETFGVPYEEDGVIKHRPFHVYSMKQAIQEGFILDVLKNYTTIDSFYKIMKTVEDDPMFDKKRAQKKLRAFVEGNEFTISKKSAMMVEHFHEQVIAKKKINGQARAMVITASIPRCIAYYFAINKCLSERHSPYKAIVAFSGDHKYKGREPALTSASMNGFPDTKIPKEFKKDPYRFLVVADMFQTGFDEPLLHTMYVDKPLYGIGAVQTLSRLNRAYPGKDDTFVLDFANKTSVIQESFAKYYRSTILSGETDPNKLYDLITTMESHQVYDGNDVERLVDLFLNGAERDRLDPTLDACAAVYKQFDTDDQIDFKSAAKSFVRTYGFLGAILPYGNVEWEKLSIFLNLLLPKLPSPGQDDLSEGIQNTIDISSYRNEAQAMIDIKLGDSDAEIPPVPAGKSGYIVEPELDLLSRIISDFNDMFGNINWNDADNVQQQILRIPTMVSRDKKYLNAMKNSDEQSARMESERALQQVIFAIMADNMELFKQYQDNPSFKKWLSDLVFNLTYNPEGKPYETPESQPLKGGSVYQLPQSDLIMAAEEIMPYKARVFDVENTLSLINDDLLDDPQFLDDFKKRTNEIISQSKNNGDAPSCDFIVGALCEVFELPPAVIQKALIESGFLSEIFNYGDFNEVFSDINHNKNHVKITPSEAFQLLSIDQSLNKLISEKRFLFVEGYFVKTDAKYIANTNDGLRLTDLAKENLTEVSLNICEQRYATKRNLQLEGLCLVSYSTGFDDVGEVDQRILKYMPENPYNNWHENLNAAFGSAYNEIMNYDEEEERTLIAMLGDTRTTLCNCLWHLIKKWNSPKVFQEKTGLHYNYFGDIRNDKKNNMKKETLLAICVGLQLNILIVEKIFEKSEYKLKHYDDPDKTYMRIITTMPGLPLDDFNGILKSAGINPLGTESRSYSKL